MIDHKIRRSVTRSEDLSFKKNKINFVVDGALFSTAVSLFTSNNLTPSVSICSPHSNGRLGKRTLGENLVTHWEDGPAYIEVCNENLTDHIINLTDHKMLI